MLVSLFLLGALGEAAPPPVANRAFMMGFTPWPWDATQAAVEWTYEKIQDHGDVVSFHIEEGVPWSETLSGAPFPAAMQQDLGSRLAKIRNGVPNILQVSALDIGRAGLALNRGANLNEPLPAPWRTLEFNHPSVKTAYANYVERLVRQFHPAYVVIGVEANLLMRNRKEKWASYVELTCATYRALKARGIKQPLLVSIDVNPFFPEWSTPDTLGDQPNVLRDLDSCVDGFAISAHPFMSALLADRLPADYFSRIFALSTRWVGIGESSYPAEVFSNSQLTWRGSEAKQTAFLDQMLDASNKQGLKFVIWFTVRDYDQLWSGLLRRDPVSLMWRDTGLYDESGRPRSALGRWTSEFRRPLQ
ncbi:MAG: hypothetical protein ABI569_13985 [Casimicrobiaceae bacterium]